jgi:hypothetical protein
MSKSFFGGSGKSQGGFHVEWAQPTPHPSASDAGSTFKVRRDKRGPSVPSITRTVRLKGLLFARPSSDLTKNQILPNLNYFHLDSADRFDFMCVGYFEARGADTVITTIGEKAWSFNDQHFIKLKDELEGKSKWQYSGGADLVLCNEIEDSSGTSLNLQTALCLDLDRLLKESAIVSFETFFQGVVRFAKSYKGGNAAWDLSDKRGGALIVKAMKSALLGLLPKGIQKQASDAFEFAVRDVSAS